MKNSLSPTGTSKAVLQIHQAILPAFLAAGMLTGCGPQGIQVPHGPQSSPGPQGFQTPQGSAAPQNNLLGQWRTNIDNGVLTLTVSASGQYMQTGVPQNGGTQTMQAGPYQLVAPNTIIFSVTNWSPKTRWIFVPNPTCGVPGVPNPTNARRDSCYQNQEWTMPQPPGSRYAYSFNGPNTMVLNNEQAQETLTFTRVTGQ
jgi:hypothetical protein